MVFSQWSPEELLSFFMVLVRVSTLLMLLPIFGDKVVPQPVKVLLSLSLAAVLFPTLKGAGYIQLQDAAEWTKTAGTLFFVLVSEIMIGLAVGFASQLVFHAIRAGGDFMSHYMGLSMATQYDPHAESQTMVVSQMLGVFAMLTFLAMDGHYMLLRALVESFHLIPQGHLNISEAFKNNLVGMVGNILFFGIQLAAPMSACMLLINIVYGVMGKALPQLNILTLSMASGVFVGSIILLISYPSLQAGFASIFENYFSDLKQFMVVYGGK